MIILTWGGGGGGGQGWRSAFDDLFNAIDFEIYSHDYNNGPLTSLHAVLISISLKANNKRIASNVIGV